MASGSMARKRDQGRRGCLRKFWLYETRSRFYLIGRNKSKTLWRVLKISKSDQSELDISEDFSSHSEIECQNYLNHINESDKSSGGLKFVTKCYGIVGFVKFFGPYYMLLITKRTKIGSICGHAIYSIAKSDIFTIGSSSLSLDVAQSRNESRYKKLFCSVDLTKDFFFSYSYPIMNSLQKNLCEKRKRESVNGSMFVWNEYLIEGIQDHLKNTFWTVSLIYGFFKQEKISLSGNDFHLTLIARRSRHYAGTRYLRRGINEKGKVANDVETEQIISDEECACGIPIQISSVVQNRGSIPLFWSQETSRLNLKPDIVLHKKDSNYEATRWHFENLAKRYGNPIIILNLIKTKEKRPRETILREEFTRAINVINEDLSDENQLKFLHWDLHSHFRRKTTNVLGFLERVSDCALRSTGFFSGFVDHHSIAVGVDDEGEESEFELDDELGTLILDRPSEVPKFQSGVLRTNCIDCLDRTNVAQYSLGLVALGHQLHDHRMINEPRIDLDTPMAESLMRFYESMGDTLALQYGGSAAHNKIFCEQRGQWKVAIQSQEVFRTLQRYYSNAYVDSWKQDAINVFLGHLRPLNGKSSLWDMDSDLQLNLRPLLERSLSEGNFFSENHVEESRVVRQNGEKEPLVESSLVLRISESSSKRLSSSVPVIPCETDTSDSRCTPSEVCRREIRTEESLRSELRVDLSTISNFMDLDWILPSQSQIGEIYSRPFMEGDSSGGSMMRENEWVLVEENGNELVETTVQDQNPAVLQEFTPSFAHWVEHGGAFFL